MIWPMHRNNTILNKTDKIKLLNSSLSKLTPSVQVLKNILQFSRVYSVERLENGQYIETFLN